MQRHPATRTIDGQAECVDALFPYSAGLDADVFVACMRGCALDRDPVRAIYRMA